MGLLMALLVLPAMALFHLSTSIDLRWLVAYLPAVSLLTYALYRHDKQRARTGGWRTPESTLHLLESLGGWPAAYLAQRHFRHKTSKRSYQSTFWTIVAIYQIVSLDSILDWQITGAVLDLLRSWMSG